MKQRLYGFSVLAAVLAALTLSGSATAGQQVPFKGRSSGVVVTTGFEDPCVSISLDGHPCVSTTLDGEGEATHLGHFTVTAKVFVDVITGIAIGSWMLTAANGDVLFVTFVGFGIDPTHGGGDMTVEGGTGRFQGATGDYTQRITFSDPPGSKPTVSYTDVLEGTISSPGSNR
jgi:hypothetical protein